MKKYETKITVKIADWTKKRIKSLQSEHDMTQGELITAAIDNFADVKKGYNGWSNYETWAVNLWLDNEPGSEQELTDIVSRYDKDDDYRAGKAIQEWVEEMNPLADDASLFSDLLSAALQEVNWSEIFTSHKADEPDEEEADD